MAEDRLAHKGDLYAQIGYELVRMCGDGVHDILLYTEAGDGWADISIYAIDTREIRWLDADTGELFERIADAWEHDAPDRRWAAMVYHVVDSRFTSSLHYSDEFNPREDAGDRREQALRDRYGDRPIRYPEQF